MSGSGCPGRHYQGQLSGSRIRNAGKSAKVFLSGGSFGEGADPGDYLVEGEVAGVDDVGSGGGDKGGGVAVSVHFVALLELGPDFGEGALGAVFL
jgi:hypothetical protein